MDEKTKWEMVKYRHEDQAKLSQHLGNQDFKTFGGFITLQLTVSGFIYSLINNSTDHAVSPTELSMTIKIAFVIIDTCLCFICGRLLWRHKKRREEVTQTIKNCNEYLGFSQVGFYLKDKAINATTENRFWFKAYIATIITFWIAFIIILFSNEINNYFFSIL